MSEQEQKEPTQKGINPETKKLFKALLSKAQRAAELRQELEELEAELRPYGLIRGQRAKSGKKAKKGERKARVPIDEAEVVKFLGKKEIGYAELGEHFGKSPLTMKKWLDTNPKILKIKADPQNPRSKVSYKVK